MNRFAKTLVVVLAATVTTLAAGPLAAAGPSRAQLNRLLLRGGTYRAERVGIHDPLAEASTEAAASILATERPTSDVFFLVTHYEDVTYIFSGAQTTDEIVGIHWSGRDGMWRIDPLRLVRRA